MMYFRVCALCSKFALIWVNLDPALEWLGVILIYVGAKGWYWSQLGHRKSKYPFDIVWS